MTLPHGLNPTALFSPRLTISTSLSYNPASQDRPGMDSHCVGCVSNSPRESGDEGESDKNAMIMTKATGV
jgi:hypothetical protein